MRDMPIVQIEIKQGRQVEQKRKLAEALTQAVVDSIGVKSESVTVIIREMALENHAVAGKLDCDK